MSLQSKLFAFFIAIVVFPLAFASFFGQSVIVRELDRRAYSELRPAQVAATVVYQERIDGGRDRIQLIATDERFQQFLIAGDFKQLEALMLERLTAENNRLDFVIVADASRTVLAKALTQPNYLANIVPPTAEEIASRELVVTRKLLFTDTRIPIRSPQSNEIAWVVVGGSYLDNEFVGSLGAKSGADATVFIDEHAVSSTLERIRGSKRSVRIDLLGQKPFFKSEIADDDVYAVSSVIKGGVPLQDAALVMSNSQEPVEKLKNAIRRSLVVLLILALFGSALLGYMLAKVISRPLREVADGARAIAEGKYDQHIEVRSRDEVGQLAVTFNEMSEKLMVHVSQLQESREELKRALARFGEMLRSTHDLDSLLEVILDTSIDTLNAKRGWLMLPGPRGAMNLAVSRHFEGLDADAGKGLAAYVAESGKAWLYPEGDAHLNGDLASETVLAVPLYSQEKLVGVLSLFDREEVGVFTTADLNTLVSLAGQAGVAIENVMLHREAQQLAIMDGLTGVFNRRYFQMQFDQEIHRAARFSDEFSVIMLDIDDFKKLNDAHGHQMGDSVLVELSRRVSAVIRDVDWFARYGGEEFILLLPATPLDGGIRTAEKIRAAVAGRPFHGEIIETTVSVTVSAGVACFPIHGRERAALIRAADSALYVAKGNGKNQVVVGEPI
ncbi:MAG: diguanylate cyclase [Actinomycetota bacterium]